MARWQMADRRCSQVGIGARAGVRKGGGCRRAGTGIAMFAICALSWAPVAQAQTWTSLGPAPVSWSQGAAGRISAVVCHPTDPNRYYVAGADGGVWRTTDGGQTWMPLTDHMPTTAIGALALDPQNPGIIYAGTGEAVFANHSRYGLGLYKSLDGGDTWLHLAEETFAGRCFRRIIINPHNPQVLYAAITQAGGFPAKAAAKNHPSADGPRGVFRSSDGGHTWVRLAGVPDLCVTDLAIDPQNPGTLYAAVGHIFGNPANGIYKTTDGGETWNVLWGLPTMGRISLALAPSDPQRIYVLRTNPATSSGGGASRAGAFRSINGGASWTSIGNGPDQSTYGWYLSVVAVHPTSPDTVFMGGLPMIRTTNAGSTWSTVTPPHVDQHAAAFDAAGRLVVGCDGGVYRSSNLGSSWESLNTGLSTIQFYAGLSLHPQNEHWVIGGTQDNGTNRRSEDTLLWQTVYGGDGGWTQVDQTSPQRVFAEFQGTGNIFRSTNGGETFSNIGGGLSGRNCFLPPYLIDPTNPMRMLYATERIFVSTVGGGSWTALSEDLTAGAGAIRSLAIAPSNPNYVYAATNDGRFLASSDGGATFALHLEDLRGWPRVMREIFVDEHDPQTVYLAGANFGQPPQFPPRLRRSRNAGLTWERLDANLPEIPVNVVAVDTRHHAPIIFVGSDAGVYRSVNEGRSWRRYGEGLPRGGCIIDIRLDLARERLVVGTQGRGAWSVPLVYCYPDLDDNGDLNVEDFAAFINAYAAGDPRANCDRSTTPPVLNVEDFTCFINAFAMGCPG
jgi:photosystem II stability/assembly factor-like uncharacterized protein